jgi:hypothetical protein
MLYKTYAMPPKTQKLLDALKAWCDQGRGRRMEFARQSAISPQTIWNWFSGRQQPTAEQILVVQEFLAKQKKRSS